MFKRNPDFGGWKFWFDLLNRGDPPTNVLNGFLNSPEFQQLYGNASNADFVTLAYRAAPKTTIQFAPAPTRICSIWAFCVEPPTQEA